LFPYIEGELFTLITFLFASSVGVAVSEIIGAFGLDSIINPSPVPDINRMNGTNSDDAKEVLPNGDNPFPEEFILACISLLIDEKIGNIFISLFVLKYFVDSLVFSK
jgi:hypothetical protein